MKISDTYWQEVKEKLYSNKAFIIGFVLIIFLLLFAIFGPIFAPSNYYETHLSLKNLPPCHSFWFGTDELGRDQFSRLAWGARISLFVGISAAIIDLVIGVIWGAVSAFFGGIVDEVMMRICDFLSAIPYLLTVILLLVVIGPGLTTIIAALTLTGWINMARIVRGQILQIKELDFVLAAQAMGASSSRIIFRHLLPNTFGPIIVAVTLTVPTAIFAESFLSFLGLGIQAPIASWGSMINDSLGALRYYPWRIFFPAGMITITMLAFNLVGDGLRDVLDPRLR